VKHSEDTDNEIDFSKVILNDKIEQISLSFLNDRIVYVNYETKKEFLKVNYNTIQYSLYTVFGKKRPEFSLHNFNNCRHSFVILGTNHPEDSFY